MMVTIAAGPMVMVAAADDGSSHPADHRAGRTRHHQAGPGSDRGARDGAGGGDGRRGRKSRRGQRGEDELVHVI